MKAVRIRRRLHSPIPELPELTGMVGKNVEIIVIEEAESDPGATQAYDFWNGPSAAELTEKQGVQRVTSIDQLQGAEEMSGAFTGFDAAIRAWRHEPWRIPGLSVISES